MIRDAYSRCWVEPAAYACMVTSPNNRRGDVAVSVGPLRGYMTRPTEFCLDTSTFLIDLRPPEAHLKLNGHNIPFVNHVEYLGVISDKRITWRLHIEMIEAKAFVTFIRI
jgi:hypothetical protein